MEDESEKIVELSEKFENRQSIDKGRKTVEKDEESDEKINIFKKVLEDKKPKTLPKRLLAEYKQHDDKTLAVSKLIDERKRHAPKTILEKAEEEKMGIERRLEDSDKQLSELIQLGDELVTNVKVANEKREVTRRNFEAIKRDELLGEMGNEQVLAARMYDDITKKWSHLKSFKEPMGLYEQMEEQKKRIANLIKQKDDFIKRCQDELKRVDEKYYEDLDKQGADIYCLVERIDNQLELMKNAYNDHLELLLRTIGQERETLALKASRKWEEIYNRRTEDEKKKTDIEKEKAKFYADEIERIALEHEEITRATKIRLEKDAENLQLELRNVKNNVLLNSEKLDYNYQVLQKRDDENVIIRNQQKRRVTKINETISTLKKKIKSIKANSDTEMKKLSREVLNLHSSIVELEAKAKNFTMMNDKKYQAVWDINYQEVLALLNKIFDIDRILNEQQLGLEWIRPNVPSLKMKDLPSYKIIAKQLKEESLQSDIQISRKKSPKLNLKGTSSIKTDEQKLADTRLLRNIVRKISERAGFLLEDKLLNILKPYSEEQKTLVRIDNIFTALDIKRMEEVNSLVEYFLPYSWCPNCSKGISSNVIGGLYHIEAEHSASVSKYDSSIALSLDVTNSYIRGKDGSVSKLSTGSRYSEEEISSADESEQKIEMLLRRSEEQEQKHPAEVKKSVQFDKTSYITLNPECSNHFLVIEPVLVLTALREFAEEHFCGSIFSFNEMKPTQLVMAKKGTVARAMSKSDVVAFWSQFAEAISEQKQKIWKSLEHGLNHYLKVLKERESLDVQCEFLRRQNLELKHLLQKYIPKQCKDEL